MVWGAFSYNGTTDSVFLKIRQCSEGYQKMLESQLHPFGKLMRGGGANGYITKTIAPFASQTLQCNGLYKIK